MQITKKYIAISLTSLVASLAGMTSYANEDAISLFPLNNYDQTITTWINPADADFNTPLLSNDLQQKRLENFYDHYFGAFSPWNADYVTQIFKQSVGNNVASVEQLIINDFNNENKPLEQINYGENFHPHDHQWLEKIVENIQLMQFANLTYQSSHRGIAVDNLHARALPTEDVSFYSYKLPGEGYPFDNLQLSALWAGTPVYILGETRDHAWLLVMTPEYIGWVKHSGIAHVDSAFINTWMRAAKNNLAAITQTQTSLVDKRGNFLLSAYVGSVFPSDPTGTILKVPVKNTEGDAIIKTVSVSASVATVMPLTATPHHFATLMNTLIGRPYGWGSLYFYNDCSAELKSLLTPFGIWLPRHSSDQITAGKIVDMSPAPMEQRLSYLMANGQRFLTLIYIGGHVMLYIGNYPNPNHAHSSMAMTYQNLWGLSPNPATKRVVIGRSALFPLLLQYPEDTRLISPADRKYFQISYLNQMPATNTLLQQKAVDVKSMMYPDSPINQR